MILEITQTSHLLSAGQSILRIHKSMMSYTAFVKFHVETCWNP